MEPFETNSDREAAPDPEQVLRFGTALLLGSLKDTPKATRRCRTRIKRARTLGLRSMTAPARPIDGEAVATAAIAWLGRVCDACPRDCEGA